jgi:ATP-dependent DNA helicase PIF1
MKKSNDFKNEILFTKLQNEALDKMKAGMNVFITGSGGVGKSVILQEYYNYLTRTKFMDPELIAKTSTTGISALNIGGRTIHSFSGIQLGEGDVTTLINNMHPFVKNRWRKTKVLFIDEISMLPPILFDKINHIGQILRSDERPFGGIQIIISGDPFQLPCIGSELQFFQADTWKSAIHVTIQLTEVMRQTDPVFQKMLSEIRYGICTEETKEILMSRVGVELKNDYGIVPTKLFPRNKDVDLINHNELEKLLQTGAEFREYRSNYIVKYNKSKERSENIIATIRNETKTIVPDYLKLCIGAQVVFRKNLSDTIVNGSRGVVTRFVNDVPMVKLLNGNEVAVAKFKFEYKQSGYFIIKEQIPLKLAYSCTIHSVQGATLDYISADIGSSIFELGQSYVVLSRVKTLDGLTLLAFDPEKIMANPVVLDYFKSDLIG